MKFELNTSLLSRVDGSAELVLGNTKLIASVTGPIEAKLRQELPTLGSLEITVRPSVGVSTTREKLLEDKLRSVLQDVIIRYKYPRQLIQIVIQFLVTDTTNQQLIGKEGHSQDYTSNELNSAINCAYFALIDADVALYNSFASTSLSIPRALKSSEPVESIIINPTLPQLVESDSHHVVCFDIKNGKANKLMLLESQGKFTEEQLFLIIEQASKQCELIHNQHQRRLVEQKISQDFIWAS